MAHSRAGDRERELRAASKPSRSGSRKPGRKVHACPQKSHEVPVPCSWAHWHADALQDLFALFLEEIGEVGQSLPRWKRFAQRGEPAWEAIERGKAVERHGLQANMAAALVGVLPKGLALACQRDVIVRPQENQKVNHRG